MYRDKSRRKRQLVGGNAADAAKSAGLSDSDLHRAAMGIL
jgi:hypothetical protein